VNTVGELAALDVADLGAGVSTVRLWEFKTKAQTLMELSGGPAALSPLADQTLLEILETPDEELAEAAKGERTAAELKEQLRWVRACLDESAFAAIRLQELLPEPGQAVSDGPEQVLRLFGLFEHELRPAGYDYNGTPLFGSVIPVELADLPRFLTRGRTLVLEQESSDGAAGPALETRVTGVEPELPAVYVDPPIAPEDGYSMGNTIVRANVVRAGHGEGRPEKVLGSGDGTLSGQSFVLKEEGVSFVADPTQPAGVRADVEIRVEGPIWRQVASLAYSKATDPDYAVSMTEDGHLKFLFGDGARGRRLPTGANNVRVRFRVGNGLSGNIPVGSLVNPVSPHPRVEGVRQPLPAVGGNAMEPLRSLRENAPASLLTLDRAVSLADFGFLAARHASVWQACAFAVPTALNRHETIEVVVVPAEGGPLGDLGNTLTSFLRSHAPPGVQIQAVTRAQMVAFDLDVTARIKSAEYEPQKILGLLRDALLESFSLPNRKLGQDLFLSEIYRVVEEVPGVENSHCVLDGNAGLRRREATPRIVYYLDPGASILALAYEEYSL
jgi:hypothetical protein